MEEVCVSVLVPVYNVERYLQKCLDSIVNQTYKNIEIIILDDGSTDESLKIIKKYSDKDSRIYYYSRENRGLLSTRIELVEKSSGDFFAFIDSDDWVEKDYIEKLVGSALRNGADVVRCGDVIEYVDEKRKRIYCRAKDNQELLLMYENYDKTLALEILSDCYYNSIHSELVRSSIVDCEVLNRIRTNQSITVGEDLVFNCNIYLKSKRIVVIPFALYHYRKNLESIMNASMDINMFKKRLDDSYNTQTVVLGFIHQFSRRYDVMWNEATVRQLDFCVNEYIKSSKKNADIKMAIRYAQDYVRLKGVLSSESFSRKYLFRDSIDWRIYFQKVIIKKWDLKFRIICKNILRIFTNKNIENSSGASELG